MEKLGTPFPFHGDVEGGSFNRDFVEQWVIKGGGLVGGKAEDVKSAARKALKYNYLAEGWRVSSENGACSPLASAGALPDEKVVEVVRAPWALTRDSSRALRDILNGYRGRLLAGAGGGSGTPDMQRQRDYMRGLQPQYINFHLPDILLPWFEVGVNRGDFYDTDEMNGKGARTGGLTALARINHINAPAGAISVEVDHFMTSMGYLEGFTPYMIFIQGGGGWTVEKPDLR